jgi:PKD repeat protein/glucose/arabinose dehydrogenase
MRRSTPAAVCLGALLLSLLFTGTLAPRAHAQAPEFHALVFTETAAFRHTSIPAGVAMFQRLAAQNNFTITHTEDSSIFNDASLAQFDVLVMLQASGDPWTAAEKAAMERYQQAGGGIVAIHNAADMNGGYEWWDNLIGAQMPEHSANNELGMLQVADRVHPSTSGLASEIEHPEEYYNFDRPLRGGAHVLLTVDEDTYNPGPAAMGPDHPISWCKIYQGGRAWVTALGHNDAAYSQAFFEQHVLGGVRWAAGVAPGDCGGTVWSNYEKVTLDSETSAPFELEVAPDGRVFYTELALGELRIWHPDTGQTTVAGEFDVYTGGEDGLLGVAIDADFEQNGWIYVYYSPASANDADPANWINRLSRFTVVGNQLDMQSERVVIDVPAHRQANSEPGHTGGGVEFGPDGNLYLSVGDDTRPFESDGRAPIDERPDRVLWDAQRTSANTNDLRGKLLRITPDDDADGGYTIPAGNMFAPGTMGTRPEIYAMGFRNPFRFKIDPATGWISLADYGPDAAADDPDRGPRGFVEWNLIKQPGNYGWPYCHGNNFAYRDYDFATGQSGPAFNCAAPVNESPNNTGLTNLPPVVPPDIWYPYDEIPEFPEMGAGGAAPMGGPFYDFDPELQSDTKFPEYFDGTPFFMEWSRNFVKELRLTDDGELLKINDFLPDEEFLAPMDMQFGPDGAMYMLDWGGGFERHNPDSSLYRIDYTQGDRRPVAEAGATPSSGIAPLQVQFSSAGSHDPEGGALTYAWTFGDGGTSTEPNPTHTYTQNGEYSAQLTVTDPGGKVGRSNVTVVVGNTAPEITFETPPHGAFFEFGDTLSWEVSVTDAEDGSTAGGGIACSDVIVQPALGHDIHAHYEAPIPGCAGSVPTGFGGHEADANLSYVFNAQYTDEGGAGDIGPITGRKTALLHPKRKQAEHYTSTSGVDRADSGDVEGGGPALTELGGGDWIAFDPVNFTGIDSIDLRVASASEGGAIELRSGAPDGTLLATAQVPNTGGPQKWRDVTIDAPETTETLALYLVFTGTANFRLNFLEANGKGVSPVSRPEVVVTSPTEGEAVDPGDVTLTANATDAEHAIRSVEFFVDGESVGTDTEAPYSVVWNQPEEDFYTVRAVATNDQGLSRESRAVRFTVGDIAIKPPWLTFANVDAGFTQVGENFTIDAAGADTWQGTDEYGAVYQADAAGENFVATVRVDSFENLHPRGKAGIMVRNDITRAGASPGYVLLAITGADGIELLHDSDGNGSIDASVFAGSTSYPTWLKLEKYGTRFIGSFSKDGTNWTEVGDITVASAAATQDIGMFTVSHVAGEQALAEFSGFTLDNDVEPPDPDPEPDPAPTCPGVRSDEFDGTELDSARWSVVRGATGDLPSVSAGSLLMPVTAGDINESSSGPISYAGQPVPDGDWQVTTKVTIDHDNEWQYAGLMQLVDDNNYIKFAFTQNSAGARFLEYQTETGGTRTWHGPNVDLPADFPTTLYMRLTRAGSTLTASYSTDGGAWTAMGGTATLKAGGTIGMVAAGDTDAANVDAAFDWFRVTPDDPPDDPGFDDEFDGAALDGCRWDRIVGYESDRVEVAGGSLSIDTFDADINGANNGPIENLILQTPPEGDWTVETKMTAPLADNWQLAGLMLYADADHYVKYDIVADNQAGQPRDLRMELRYENGGPLTGPGVADPDPPASATDTWWLRLTKTGDTYTGAVSADGETWVQTPGSVTAALNDPAIGLIAIGPSQAAPTTVDFDYIRLVEEPTNSAPAIESADGEPTIGFGPLEVDFTVAASDPDGDELTYSWDFDGDGSADSTQQSPSHTYAEPGEYRAEVTVSDGELEATETVDVQVLEPDDDAARFRTLVFSKTSGFRHSSIDEGHAALEQLGDAEDFQVDHTEDATAFRGEILDRYDTVVFLSTTGDVFDSAQQAAFEDYIQAGGGYAGIHSASDTEYEWNWYGKLVGAYFRNHPANQTATVHVEDDAHPSTAALPRSYDRFDEWYNFKSPDFATVGDADYSPRGQVHVLARIDESTYTESDGNGTDDDHPLTWCQRYDGGRSWYTAMGHTEASFTEARFLEQVLGGLETTAGVAISATCGESRSGPGAPAVTVTPIPASGRAPLDVKFNVKAIDPNGGTRTYDWRFGDGTRSTETNPRHVYSQPGAYTATVIVTDDEGEQGTAAVKITVTAPQGPMPPTVTATASPTSGTAPLRVAFSATGQDPDGKAADLKYRWDFGDGNRATSRQATHTYRFPGVYIARVTVTDKQGLTGSAEIQITVTDP